MGRAWGIRAGSIHATKPVVPGYTGCTDMLWLIWLIVAVVLLAAELHTQAFYALFLSAGALAAVILAAVGLPVVVQAVGGGAVAVLGVAAARPGLKSLMDRHSVTLRYPGMAGGLVGQRAITVDDVGDEHHHGHAMLANERWLAVTDEPQPLPAGTPVVVAGVRGTTLLVRAGGAPGLR
jgi:membrane protein implicated in regulation of membrane protease activity